MAKTPFVKCGLLCNGDYSREAISQIIKSSTEYKDLGLDKGLDEVRAYYRQYGFDALVEKLIADTEAYKSKVGI